MYDLLQGYRVVEGAAFIAGPSCGLHLAQMGAEVIRFDAIGGGPDFRRWPLAPDGTSLYWEGLNKGKKSIALDLRSQEGRELALAIASAPGERGGLFVTNYPVSSFLSHHALAERRPDIITLRVMGWADGSPAVDYTVNAAVGIPYMTGPEEAIGPVNHVLPAWDLMAGAYAAFALSAALLRRTATGQGSEIRLSLSDLAATTLSHIGNVAEVLVHGDRPRLGNDLYGAFGRDFACSDGVRLIAVAITAKQWDGLLKALGLAEPVAALERVLGVTFGHNEGARFIHRAQLKPLFEVAFAAADSKTLARRFDDAGVTWGDYKSLKDAVTTDPRLFTESPLFQTLDHPSGLRYPAAGPPVRLPDESAGPVRPAPKLGADTDEILASVLGLTRKQIDDLRQREVVA